MSVFNPNIPLPTDFLSVSQSDIKDNFTQLDTSFGVDHYAFSNGTANNGKHNQVTTPLISGSAHPTTAADEPKFYGMQQTANVGVLQYSRGGSDAVPTPLTAIHSSSGAVAIAAAATINLLDFTGINLAYYTVYAINSTGALERNSVYFGHWNGTFSNSLIIRTSSTGPNLTSTGNVLQLTATVNLNNVYWTIVFHRLA